MLLIGGYPLLMVGLGLILGSRDGPALAGGVEGLLFVCLETLVIFGLLFALGWLASRATANDLLLRWRPGWWVLPLGIGYSVALRIAVGVLMIMVTVFLLATRVVTPHDLEAISKNSQRTVETIVDVKMMRSNPFYFFLTVTLVSFVVAGFREELWRAGLLAALRKLWPRWFASRGGEIAAVGLAAIVFGLGHFPQGAIGVALTSVLGFGLGLMMIFHRSIWPAVFAHGMFDATSMALIPYVVEKIHQYQIPAK